MCLKLIEGIMGKIEDSAKQKFIWEKIRALEVVEAWVPGIKIIQNVNPFRNLFICSRGLKRFGLTRGFFEQLSLKEYQEMVFDPENSNTCLVGISEYDEMPFEKKEIYVRHGYLGDQHWIDFVTVYDLFPDKSGKPHFTLTQILPMKLQPWAASKAGRLVTEMAFMEENKDKFDLLTDRNKEVLSLMAKCLSADQISEQLFIGTNTVNTHKKRIKEVLETNENWEIIRYGLAFDLL